MFGRILAYWLTCQILFGGIFSYKINIGLLYEEDNIELKNMFLKAIDDVNVRILNDRFPLSGVTESIPYGNTYSCSKKLCKMLRTGVAAIFGPLSSNPAIHAMSVCDVKEIPYFDVRWDLAPHLPAIRLHPQPQQILHVVADIIKGFHWRGFTALYESGPYLPVLHELLEIYHSHSHTVNVRKYDLDKDGNYRDVLRAIRKNEEKKIVIVGSIRTLPDLLKQAQQVGIMTDHYEYVIANLDLHTIDLFPYQYSDANITTIRLVNIKHKVIKSLVPSYSLNNGELETVKDISPLSVSAALIYDAVLLLAHTFKNMNRNDMFYPMSLDCNDTVTWDKGYSLFNDIKTTSLDGITGEIKFNSQGQRTDFKVDVVELAPSGLHRVGTWNSTREERLHIDREMVIIPALDERTLRNKTFIVLTALTDPYGMLKHSSQTLTGNDRFEGYGIDLIKALSKELGFNYTFHIQEDGNYGTLNQNTNTWNGMMREIIDERADLAIADLTITSERETGVDFTTPFMNLGISILYKRPSQQDPEPFSFMSPLSNDVWISVGGTYIIVSVIYFCLARVSPKEWQNKNPHIQKPKVLKNQLDFRNCLWVTIATLLQQGIDTIPRGAGTRTMGSIWGFFRLIMVSTYTANLMAFLTIVTMRSPISNAADLANLNGAIKYGAKHGGSTINFFKDANEPIYKKMYEYMKKHEELLTSSNEEGLERVKNENYAYIMESTSIQYLTQRHCEVAQVGTPLDEKGYGIAMKKNSPYRDALSQTVLHLQERGVLDKLKNKWWKEKRGGGACSQMRSADAVSALSTAHLGGVFLVFVVGSVAATLYGICEWLYFTYKRAKYLNVSFKEELNEEFKFLCKITKMVKPVKQPKSPPIESVSDSSDTIDSTESEEGAV